MKAALTVFAAALAAGAAFGQVMPDTSAPQEAAPRSARSTYVAQVPWPLYVYAGPGTPASSYAFGAAAMTEAAGEYNRLTAQARIAHAEARRYELENQLLATQTYFQMRLMNREYRAMLRGPRPTMDDLKRYAAAELPKPLSPSDFDAVTGEISWPILLRDERYADYRAELESLFAERAAADEFSTASYLKLHRTTRALLEELKKSVRHVPQMDYIAAKRFVESLAYEARQPKS